MSCFTVATFIVLNDFLAILLLYSSISFILLSSAWVPITPCHRLDDLNNKYVFLTVQESRRYETKVWPHSLSLCDLQIVTSLGFPYINLLFEGTNVTMGALALT